jgi:hypothetical protein
MSVNISPKQVLEPGIKAGPEGVPKSPPAGYGPVKSVRPEFSLVAVQFLKSNPPYGMRQEFTVDGKDYIARVEPHPPAKERGLNIWHKGVTVYERITKDSGKNYWGVTALLFMLGAGSVLVARRVF